MENVKNDKLGNFGFLLDYKEDHLFELAQLAESNMYINQRLCATYIRQLIEHFFYTVMEIEGIAMPEKKESEYMPRLFDIQLELVKYFNNTQEYRPKYKRKVFPMMPGTQEAELNRLQCPEGEGDDRYKSDHKLVDPDKSTLYVWNYLRKLGNAGSHGSPGSENSKWLDEKYIVPALEQLYMRMRWYFVEENNEDPSFIPAYDVRKAVLTSREMYYPVENSAQRVVEKEAHGILPGYVESEYYTVMPKVKKDIKGEIWDNYVNKYSIIRRYKIDDNSDGNTRNFFLQSQKAYLKLQELGRLSGVASYSVIVDLRNSSHYYVASYQFDSRPLNVGEDVLLGEIFLDEDRMVQFIMQYISIVIELCKSRVYHRNMTHRSIKLCKEDEKYNIKLMDFEFVKLFDDKDVGGKEETVFLYANEALKVTKKESNETELVENEKQYGRKVWRDDTSELEYQKHISMRTGMIISNFLCPRHFDDRYDFEEVAQRNEILSDNNSLYHSGNISKEKVELIYDIIQKLITGEDSSLKNVYSALEGVLHGDKQSR